MKQETWLLRLKGVQLSVLLAVVQGRTRVFTAVELAALTGYSRQRVSWALSVLEREGMLFRVHRTGWRVSGSAVVFIHNIFVIGDMLRQDTKIVHSTLNNVTLEDNGRAKETAQSEEIVHSMLNNVTLGDHDHDYDDDEKDIIDYRVIRLIELGFSDGDRWLSGKDGRLVDAWLDWHADLDPNGRSRFKNVGGYIRKQVEAGKLPPAKKRQVPPEWEDIVRR